MSENPYLVREGPTYRDGTARVLDPHRVGRLQRDLIGYYQRVERMLRRVPRGQVEALAKGEDPSAGKKDGDKDGEVEDTEGTEMSLFIENTWEEALGDIRTAACHVYCSKVVERLVEASSPRQVARFLDAVGDEASMFMASQYGCHVMETALAMTPWLIERENKEYERYREARDSAEGKGEVAKVKKRLAKAVVRCATAVSGGAVEHARDRYATHPLRRLIITLGGMKDSKPPTAPPDPSKKKKKKKGGGGAAAQGADGYGAPPGGGKAAQHRNRRDGAGVELVPYEAPPSFADALVSLVDELFDRDPKDVYQDLYHPQASPVVSALVRIGDADSTARLARRLIAFDDGSVGVGGDGETGWMYTDAPKRRIAELSGHKCGAPFLEELVKRASGETRAHLYPAFFRGKLASLSRAAGSSYVVQALVSTCDDGAQMRLMADEIAPVVGELSGDARFYVAVRLAEAVVRFSEAQKGVCRALTDLLTDGDVDRRRDVARALVYFEGEGGVSGVGCRMLSAVVRYSAGAAKPFVDGFIALSPTELAAVAADVAGSRLIDSFMDGGAHVTPEARIRLVKRFRGQLCALACDRLGSRVVERLFTESNVEGKSSIAAELAQRASQLEASFSGRFCLRSCRVADYLARNSASGKKGRKGAQDAAADAWAESVRKGERTKEMFADILADEKNGSGGNDGNGDGDGDGDGDSDSGSGSDKGAAARKVLGELGVAAGAIDATEAHDRKNRMSKKERKKLEKAKAKKAGNRGNVDEGSASGDEDMSGAEEIDDLFASGTNARKYRADLGVGVKVDDDEAAEALKKGKKDKKDKKGKKDKKDKKKDKKGKKRSRSDSSDAASDSGGQHVEGTREPEIAKVDDFVTDALLSIKGKKSTKKRKKRNDSESA